MRCLVGWAVRVVGVMLWMACGVLLRWLMLGGGWLEFGSDFPEFWEESDVGCFAEEFDA